jgi:hypothetical protein
MRRIHTGGLNSSHARQPARTVWKFTWSDAFSGCGTDVLEASGNAAELPFSPSLPEGRRIHERAGSRRIAVYLM